MPQRLTDRAVRNLRPKPGRKNATLGDGRGGYGLTIVAQLDGCRHWTQRLSINGQVTYVGLGPYPLVSLAEARNAAFQNARAARRGEDPRRRKRKPDTSDITLAAAADACLQLRAKSWRSPKSAERWRQTMALLPNGILSAQLVDLDAKTLAKPCAAAIQSRPFSGKLLVRQLKAIMSWAVAGGHRGDNPIDDAFMLLLPRPSKVVKHHAALPYTQVGDALCTIRAAEEHPLSVRLLLETIILTAARFGEAAGARWSEFDLKERVWTVPAERTKRHRRHRVPMSDAMMDVLERAGKEGRDAKALVFPGLKGQPVTSGKLLWLLGEYGLDCTTHGFRSSFRDWAGEVSGCGRNVIEVALSHAVMDSTEAAYARSDLLELRRGVDGGMGELPKRSGTMNKEQAWHMIPFLNKFGGSEKREGNKLPTDPPFGTEAFRRAHLEVEKALLLPLVKVVLWHGAEMFVRSMGLVGGLAYGWGGGKYRNIHEEVPETVGRVLKIPIRETAPIAAIMRRWAGSPAAPSSRLESRRLEDSVEILSSPLFLPWRKYGGEAVTFGIGNTLGAFIRAVWSGDELASILRMLDEEYGETRGAALTAWRFGRGTGVRNSLSTGGGRCA